MNTFVTITPIKCFAIVTINYENKSNDYIISHIKKYFNDWQIIKIEEKIKVHDSN